MATSLGCLMGAHRKCQAGEMAGICDCICHDSPSANSKPTTEEDA